MEYRPLLVSLMLCTFQFQASLFWKHSHYFLNFARYPSNKTNYVQHELTLGRPGKCIYNILYIFASITFYDTNADAKLETLFFSFAKMSQQFLYLILVPLSAHRQAHCFAAAVLLAVTEVLHSWSRGMMATQL